MIEAISHITIVVRDVEKTAHFLRTVFDAREVYDSRKKNFSMAYVKYFIVGGTWIAVMEGESLPERSYNHVAFKVPDSEFDKYVSRIRHLGVDIKPGRDRVSGEARSLYFYDYDNHLFELHTGTLENRLVCYSED